MTNQEKQAFIKARLILVRYTPKTAKHKLDRVLAIQGIDQALQTPDKKWRFWL